MSVRQKKILISDFSKYFVTVFFVEYMSIYDYGKNVAAFSFIFCLQYMQI